MKLFGFPTPAFSPPDEGGGAPSGVSEAPGGADLGGPVDAGPSDTSFLISDEVMNSSNLDESIEVPSEPTGAEAPAAAQAPKAAETAPPATEAKPPVQGQQPQAPKAPAPARTAEPSPQPITEVADPRLLEALAQNREQLISHLADTRFKLTKEEGDLLDKDANAGIQRIAARVYYEASTSALQVLQKFQSEQLPRLIEQHLASTKTYDQATDEFYRAWPNLDRGADDEQVRMYANIYRRANPSATRQEAIKAVGTIVTSVLGKAMPAASRPATARPNGPRPFSPASAASRGPVTRQPVESPFAGLGQEFD